MPVQAKREVRRGQLITTYGVGAIVAVEDQSFMVAGIDRWRVAGPNLHEPRLERELRVDGFVLPPATERGQDIPVLRFPEWCSCPGCRRLAQHHHFTSREKNSCNRCDSPLVPSRFVIACERGHIDEFPYFQWVHAGSRPTGTSHEMTIDTGGTSASLRSIEIRCSCGKVVTMEGALGRQALQGIVKCSGRRPWLTGPPQQCSELPRTLQRGASNVWFPIVASAISIPPWSEGAFKLLNRHWPALRAVPEDALKATISVMNLTRGTQYTVDDLVLAVRERKAKGNTGTPSEQSMRAEEYEALTRGKSETSRDEDFVCVPAAQPDDVAGEWFRQVMVVKRLREVRVLESFTRVVPPGPGTPPERRAALYDQRTDWLPAIEVNGEGIFLRLDPERLKEWESRAAVVARAARINQNYERKCSEGGVPPDRKVTPRLVLLHTLAHVLINQWSLDSGYPAASLRERLYVSDSMAGILIYTATSDSAGSLGGVAGQAAGGRLGASLLEATARASWCSADPLCVEADAAGADSLNLAACHACVLLPEVSCEEANVLLDRGLLTGTPENQGLGYFSPLLTHARYG
jgi:hypothetical protein